MRCNTLTSIKIYKAHKTGPFLSRLTFSTYTFNILSLSKNCFHWIPPFKGLESVRIFMLVKSILCAPKIYLHQENIKYFFINVIYSSDGTAHFSASLLQFSMSHDPSEIIVIGWLAYKKKNKQKKQLLLNIFEQTTINFFFRIFW